LLSVLVHTWGCTWCTAVESLALLLLLLLLLLLQLLLAPQLVLFTNCFLALHARCVGERSSCRILPQCVNRYEQPVYALGALNLISMSHLR
jgi:hypothetical protein